MVRDLEHFELPKWQEPLPVRKNPGGGGGPGRGNRREHGERLDQQVEAVTKLFEDQVAQSPPQIHPKFIFKLRFDPRHGSLDESQLQRMGLRVLAHEAAQAVVVFPDEASLVELRRRVREYAGLVPDGHQYGELDAIEAIVPLGREDRIGSRLRAEPLAAGEVAPLDVELWHSGDRAESRARIGEVRDLLTALNLSLTDDYVGASLCLLRAQLDSAALELLLETDYVKEIDRRPTPAFEMLPVVRLDLSDIESPETEVADDLVGVLVIDSGVMGRHPLLAPTLGDAQVFPHRQRARLTGGAEDGDREHGGHGTSVAGIAVYNDIGECIKRRTFDPTALLFSARVTDDQNQYDPDVLLEHQLEEALQYFLENYPQVRVINISLGDSAMVYEDGYQFRFAAAIDELAYRFRDREILFVVSAGNFWPDDLSGEEILETYPHYLLERPDARVIDPATSALALTVGGLSYGEGKDLHGYTETRTERAVAGERGWPSPFTRTGTGVNGAIKPDVVDYAGDWRFQNGSIRDQPVYAGIPSISKKFAPPEGRLFRMVAGTSFAAPRVANLAARLFRQFPSASSNLVRALIASSARVPDSRPQALESLDVTDTQIQRLYGYGQPSYERARWSSEQEVLLTADDTIDVDSFHLYVLPALPDEFLSASGIGVLDVTLAYDPPTRHTRGDNYFGVGMEAQLFRNLTPEQVADVLRVWEAEEKEVLTTGKPPSRSTIRASFGVNGKVDLVPGVNSRKKSTLQRGFCRIATKQWNYDGNPLVLAVTCRRTWAPADVDRQRFAVVVTLAHENPDVRLHAHIRAQLRLQQRAQVRV